MRSKSAAQAQRSGCVVSSGLTRRRGAMLNEPKLFAAELVALIKRERRAALETIDGLDPAIVSTLG